MNREDFNGTILSCTFSWDMTKEETIKVPHKIDFERIRLMGDRSIFVTIVDDTEKVFNGLMLGGGGLTIRKDHFELWRPKDCVFDGPNYKRTDIVRGYIKIPCKPIYL